MIWHGGRSVQAELQTLSIDGLELIDTDDYCSRRPTAWTSRTAGSPACESRLRWRFRGIDAVRDARRQPVRCVEEQRRRRDERRRSALGAACLLKGRERRTQLKTISFTLLDGREFTFQAEVSSFGTELRCGRVEFRSP